MRLRKFFIAIHFINKQEMKKRLQNTDHQMLLEMQADNMLALDEFYKNYY